MTDTEVKHRILGTAWPRHFNRVIAETMDRHIRAVGLPQWSAEDQALARAVQKEVGTRDSGGYRHAALEAALAVSPRGTECTTTSSGRS